MAYSSGRSRIPLPRGLCFVISTIVGIFIYTIYMNIEYFQPILFLKRNYIRLHDSTLLSVFSAVMHIDDQTRITLNVWDGSSNMNYKCCILTSDAQLVQVNAKPLNAPYAPYDENMLSARQYKCSLSSSKNHVISVAMISASKTCAMTKQFTNVIYPSRPRVSNRFVIYSVLTREVRPIQLVEWLEYYKSVGVDKIYLVLQLPDAQIMTVLSHYLKNGFLEIHEFPFPLPGRSQDDVDRNFAIPTDDAVRRQLDQDKLVAIFHCIEYLRGFGYAAYLDVNEFIVTSEWRMLIYFLEETFERNFPDAAGVNLKYVYIDRDQSNLQVNNRTEQINYRTIHVPGRIQRMSSNIVIPRTNYDVYTIPEDKGVVYLIRHCRAMWIFCIKNHSSSTLKLYHSRTDLERKCLAVAAKLYLNVHHPKLKI
ncbi:uncharacterized protein LOC110443081 [Mizuhopecten yessoensis]|uniref:Glycosyltransferase family 92 protein n=1 Tax=Mizuhopecten yessoensis TaxID=6573 RepID=A0A210PFR2_MIZYE|nr:uncharacterized protein LOC110443081 [Mizuhopecten yessoensis]OWF35322.1 hypothetical protein KP79_PYT03890 [Mizuhopecten yessoensis]